MKRMSVAGLLIGVMLAGCGPGVSITPTVTLIPPSVTPEAVLADPPPCADADLMYHAGLGQVIMTRCAPEPSSAELPNVIWGWDGAHWSKIAEGGPKLRVVGGAAYDSKRNVLVQYGGLPLTSNTCDRDTWEWDGRDWSKKEVDGPGPCDHFKMIYDAASEKVILFSGQKTIPNLTQDTWAWDGENWTLLSSDKPSGRAHFGFVYDAAHEQGLVYGGIDQSSIKDDFWAWKDGAWSPIEARGPGALSHFGIAIDGDANALIIFGGATGMSTFKTLTDRMWILTGGAWSEVQMEVSPGPRGSPAMTYDPDRKKIVLYGGFDANGSNLDDTWEWDGTAWECTAHCP